MIMEAATLKTKKTVNKGKMKKTLKNVLCRPDPVFWPLVTEDQKALVATALGKYRLDIPVFNKPHWKDLKLLPKDKRPKPPKVRKIEGLLFGISECSDAVHNNSCAVIIIESAIHPRLIVQPVIEACINKRVPVICVSDLRTMSTNNFGIPTSCLGIKCNCLPDLTGQILGIANTFKLPPVAIPDEIKCADVIDIPIVKESENPPPLAIQSQYLFRTNKKTRVFNPSEDTAYKSRTNFSGQDFLQFDNKESLNTPSMDRKSYMKMVLKKISNNPNRKKLNKIQ